MCAEGRKNEQRGERSGQADREAVGGREGLEGQGKPPAGADERESGEEGKDGRKEGRKGKDG